MMKGLMFQQQIQQPVVEENMSNLTSASGEPSVSPGNRTEIGTNYSQQYFDPTPPQTQPVKKKRNLPGNPDPDAEVIALSPKTLMATNRFICEICNKGFQRDQNLQLHRRGHNLPWKLKQRTSKEVKKKVYVCPEPSCVHHDPSRALGDLTGIKKHFSRKHGEKKWKCDKCAKKYAVQSDWKAHSKTCGTREYRCDCGTLFSRRDSFITHRAFCDALAEESARAITTNQLLSSQAGPSASHINQRPPRYNPQDLHAFSLKKEQQSFSPRPEIPPWLASPGPPPMDITSSSSFFSTRSDYQEFTQSHQELALHETPPNPNPILGPTLPPYQPASSPHMSATALLQKAAQMGATVSNNTGSSLTMMQRSTQQVHVPAAADSRSNTTGKFGSNLSSREEMATGFVHGLASFEYKAAGPSASTAAATGASTGAASGVPPSLLHDMVGSLSSTTGFEGTSFEDAFGGILNSNKDGNSHDTLSKTFTTSSHLGRAHESGGNGGGGGGGGGEGLTRDFLGLRALSHSDILSIAGLGNCMNTSNEHLTQSQKPWQGWLFVGQRWKNKHYMVVPPKAGDQS
ncbi:protein indeterminate-domain 7-like isoform X1 [Juglans microcarpa x Juglans regia]|uniref:protein indeterminate-domain 7-like isoform X1 n=2 Tax=Juglans microcarpa x Juglans regia TaxID=2249226 RepID=UPI001B7E2A08|nr:protein indeterminate-domain 7-like isoform X1 [Juglans microcarpa x Juglans regia]XP_041000776.1 protein indeterminate-domain 7-like isoform X1 [Juglans microcarpa x Juglans regia]